MPSVMVTGASRGIGFEFVRQYAEAGYEVHALARNPHDPKSLLNDLAKAYPNIRMHALDVSDFSAIELLGRELADHSLDILMNNAGVYGPREAQSLGRIDDEAWMSAFRVNALAPLKMVEAFLPHLERGSKKVIANISTQMASIGDNTSGGSYIYRSTKAALNMVLKNLSMDLRPKGIWVLIIHPGWVRTDMGGPGATLSPKESVTQMRRLIERADAESSGKFLDYRGEELPW